jgi:Uncharacterized lipoprotein
MRHPFLALALVGSVLLNGAVFAGGESLENIPLKWSPTSTLAEWGAVDLSGATITTKVQLDPLTDTRQNPSLVAENREKANVRSVTTSSDVAAFVGDHLKESLHGAGLNIVDSGADVIVSGEIRKFFVTELSTYNGEITLLLHVKSSDGKELWTGIASGDATRWGRSYHAANYYETMSNMVLSATYNLLNNPSFRDSLAKH